MKEYAERFYKSKQWQKTAAAYAKSKQNLCEICRDQGLLTPGEIVHHKIQLNESNIADPDISLNWDNLQFVCRKCHAAQHKRKNKKRYTVDSFGRVTGYDTPPD